MDNCTECKYYNPIIQGVEGGNCRRYPPIVVWITTQPDGGGDLTNVHPYVTERNLCGEFEFKLHTAGT